MRRSNLFAFLAVLFSVVLAPAVAYAGGPLILFDPSTGTPYKYKGPVAVYTDLGNLGLLSNDAADAKVAFAWSQWTDVPSSSFEATVRGDFSSLGLGDITSSNASQIFTTYNGGGIHVVYDTDATILRDFFGVGQSVQGIASPEVIVEGTDEIVESWVILNGKSLTASDPAGARFAGVMTHEFGHSINLAHSQTNGGVIFSNDSLGPAGCTSLPYSITPLITDIETMYPFINLAQTGVAQSTVEQADDIASISNLYPASDYDSSHGTISGTIITSDGEKITGVNVVARNVANPWRDAVSALSGDYSQGRTGPDGRYALRGLTPGAQYVLYVDGIINGGFSTPPALFLPGQEEFYNGVAESGDGMADEACDVTPITALAGTPVTADIILNATEGAPTITILGAGLNVTDMTDDGRTVVGILPGVEAPAFLYTDEGGLVNIGGSGGFPSISPDGTTIVANIKNLADGNRNTAAIWQGGTSWLALPGLSMATSITRTAASGATNDGSVVVGLGYDKSRTGAALTRAFRWDAETNTSSVLETPDTSNQSRANGIAADGSLIYGYHAFNGPRNGVFWNKGVFTPLYVTRYPVNAPPVTYAAGEALNSNADGTVVVGSANDYDGRGGHPFWRWTASDGMQEIESYRGFAITAANALNADGSVIVGFGRGKPLPNGNFDNGVREGFIWISRLGLIPLADFLTVQGTRVPDGLLLSVPNSLSAKGNRIGGAGGIFPFGTPVTWLIDIRTVRICHSEPGGKGLMETLQVSFPEGLDEHLDHGDTLGPCACESDGSGKDGGGH